VNAAYVHNYVTLLNYCHKGHKCNNTGSNAIDPSQQLKQYRD